MYGCYHNQVFIVKDLSFQQHILVTFFFLMYFLLDKLNHNAEKNKSPILKIHWGRTQNPYSMCPLNADPQASPILHNLFKVTSTTTIQNDMY